MAGINYSQPILGAGASAKTDFAAAQARTSLDFQGEAQFRRGVKAEIGIGAFADASAGLSKFIHASIDGTAFARAKAGIQLQLPLNLFDEFGFAARAEAIAEAAAGVRAQLGISIGDFILLAKRDPNLVGLPFELLLLFLEEVSIGGEFEVNVSASAKAHASITIAGTIIEKAGEKAGFFYTIDAGLGLAAGVGMGLQAGAEFDDFRRFFGRAVDLTVDKTIHETLQVLPSSAQQIQPALYAFGAVAKIAFRIAYDIGLKVYENVSGADPRAEMNTLCNEVVKTFLEEAQRFIINKMLETAVDKIRQALEQQIPSVGQATWDAAKTERDLLATQLFNMPPEPFQPTHENIDYWKGLITKSLNLFSRLYGRRNPAQELSNSLSIIYCTSELLIETIKSKVNNATAYAMVIGAGLVNADTQPFKGNLTQQPPTLLKNAINDSLGNNRAHNISYADLLSFLLNNNSLINSLLSAYPEVKEFMSIFKIALGKQENEILTLFLQHASAFIPDAGGSGQMSPKRTLQAIVNSLDTFITNKFRNDALPVMLVEISDPNLRLFIEEVLFEAVVFVKDIGLNTVLNWENNPPNKDDFTESLSSVLMLLLGRPVVIVGDTFITAAQEAISTECNKLADAVESSDTELKQMGLPVDADFKALAANCLRIGGEVLGPYEADTRSRIRHVLYQIFEIIPPGREQDFADSLADQFFIPNREHLESLTNELWDISRERFILFAEKFIGAIGDYILQRLEEFILAIIDLVLKWEKHLAESILALADFLKNLENTIRKLNTELIARFVSAENALRNFLDSLHSSTLKSNLKTALKNKFIDKALDILYDNTVYKNVPSEFRYKARDALRSVVGSLVDNPLTEPIYNIIGNIAGNLEDLIPEFRDIVPEENLPSEIMRIVLDKMEDNIRDHFGSTKPGIDVGFDFGYTFYGNFVGVHISLGRVKMNLNPFIDFIRDKIEDFDFYLEELTAASLRLADAFAKELELAAAMLVKEEKEADKERLEKMDAEHNNAPKEIIIFNPAPLSHHTKKINVKIQLGGVPMSYFGLGKDEKERVLIYLNGKLIPAKSLLIDEAEGVKAGDIPLHDFDFVGLKSFNAKTGILENSKSSILINTAAHVPQQEKNKQDLTQKAKPVYDTSPFKLQSITSAAAPKKTKSHSSGASVSKSVSLDKSGRMISNHVLNAGGPGRNLNLKGIEALLQKSVPGLLVQFKIETEQLVEGVNVLTVVVIERGGNRHQQNVSYTVSPESRTQIITPVVDIFHPETGKKVKTKLSLNGIMGKTDEKKKKNQKAVALDTEITDKRLPVVSKETIEVIDERTHTVKTIEIKYKSNLERRKILQDQKVANKKIKTTKIVYEKGQAVAAVAKKLNSMIPITAKDFKTMNDEALKYLKEQNDRNFKDNNIG